MLIKVCPPTPACIPKTRAGGKPNIHGAPTSATTATAAALRKGGEKLCGEDEPSRGRQVGGPGVHENVLQVLEGGR